MSTINTNGINVNYPVPGVNNNSQGFRDNFSSTKTNLDIAANEISDLQNKVVVKSALDNTIVNNDMANTLISNAAVRGFRSTTYNLGNALSGTVLVNATLGDVQYGTIAGDVTLQFGSWAPAGTQSNIELQLAVSNSSATVTFPSQVVFTNNNYGVTTLENFANVANTPTITIPYGVSQVDYRLSTVDCGNTILIEPYNRPRQSAQIQQRTPAPTGFLGDVAGTVAVSPAVTQLTVTNTYANDEILTTSTSSLYVDQPVVFTGTTFGGVTAGTTYFVKAIPSATNFTIAATAGASNVNLSAASGTMYVNPASYAYVCTADFNSTEYAKTVSNTTVTTNAITLNNTTSLVVNAPIVFSGTAFGGLSTDTVYYIKTISSPNITVSMSRTNGVADTAVSLTTANNDGGNISFTGTAYIGSDIWKRIQLTSW